MESLYKCNFCGKITLHKKKLGKDFPLSTMCECCYSMDTRRIWEPIQYNVKKGQSGNASNGYTAVNNMHDFDKD